MGEVYTFAVTDVKHRTLTETLKKDILGGKYGNGNPFPSVRTLIKRFGLSNTTVLHAMDELVRQGLISRKQGRGTFVCKRCELSKIGLIIPGMAYSEFFPPIVSAISRLAQENGRSLLFADVSSSDPDQRAKQAKAAADRMVEEHVAGVIFQPLEFIKDSERMNYEIVSRLQTAGVSVVLLDYDVVPPPLRSDFDIVGINNSDAGYRLAEHLLKQGARRIAFLMRTNWAPSVRNRLRGVVTALGLKGLKCDVLEAEPDDASALARFMRRRRPEAFICGNDTAAAVFKKTLEKQGFSVPKDVLLAAFDDVRLASLLSPSLTTIHQPCREIGEAAFSRLLVRIANPGLLPQEIYLPAPLVVRASTTRLSKKKQTKKKGTKP